MGIRDLTTRKFFRLGTANPTVKNGDSWASEILGLTGNDYKPLVYQQQLVHSTNSKDGPALAASEMVGSPDNDKDKKNILREISGGDTPFSRRNLSIADNDSRKDFYFKNHINNNISQMYYLGNEVETSGAVEVGVATGDLSKCWNPRNFNVDNYLNAISINTDNYWEVANSSAWTYTESPCAVQGDYKRVYATKLAQIYQYIQQQAENAGKGHIVFPPSSNQPEIGGGTGYQSSKYWDDFYLQLKALGVAPSKIPALHLHSYETGRDWWSVNTPYTPMDAAASNAMRIRNGVRWYRRYIVGGGTYEANPNNYPQMPHDLLLSEMGYDHKIEDPINALNKYRWAGGWTNFRDGLSWWNTWLCWLTRMAKYDCGISGEVLACAHHMNDYPYAKFDATVATSGRSQWYLNIPASGTPSVQYVSAIPSIQNTNLQTVGDYMASFAVASAGGQSGVKWSDDNTYWKVGPFGAAYKVWACVADDPAGYSGNPYAVSSIKDGFVYNKDAGYVGGLSAPVSLKAGFNTVYIPIIKENVSGYPSNTQLSVNWTSGQTWSIYHGYIDLSSVGGRTFPESKNWTIPNQSPNFDNTILMYSAALIPAVCYAGADMTVNVNIYRNISGPYVWIGRPISIPQACSWFWFS